jgi:hypothetical protein
MSDSLMDITLTSNYTSVCESDGEGGTVYIIDGKVWRIGEHKISKWSKAKCNNTNTVENIFGSIVTNDNNTNK